MMRIITGRARGTHLVTLPGETTRPTSERTKEAVFSMIQFELAGRTVLDLFAGSGQMALEAVSRGAARAILVDASKQAVDVIRTNIERTHFERCCGAICADYADFLLECDATRPARYGLIFLDPPYAKRLVAPALRLIVEARRMVPGALIVCESDQEDVFEGDADLAAHFTVRKTAKYGVAYVTLLEWREKNFHV